MVIQPKIRGFICTTAHPTGCFEHVKQQIDFISSKKKFNCKKNVLIIGCSAGYGLACRIACAFGGNASTIGVMSSKPATEKRTAKAGWYNTAAFEIFAKEKNLFAKTIIGDAFLNSTIDKTIEEIKKTVGKVDLIIYSLAAPRRTLSDQTVVSSVLKTVGADFVNKTLNLATNEIEKVVVPKATEIEIENTIKVMGGENWKNWIFKLNEADAIADDALTIAFSYVGPTLTKPIYADGTIGLAKKHLLKTANEISTEFKNIKGLISINKALVTQSSAAIPIVPLYLTILYKIMKEQQIHEGCIEQAYRLFSEKINNGIETDSDGLIRLDDFEMKDSVQEKVSEIWQKINSNNVKQFTDVDGFWEDFNKIFGFGFKNVDYSADVNQFVDILSVNSSEI